MATEPIEWFVGPGEDDNKEFGEWLQSLRLTAGLTRVGAANRLYFGVEFIRLMERGKRTPDSADMGRICKTYEVLYQKLGMNVWRVDDKTIVFTSRILEVRRSSDKTDVPKVENRLEILGWIVDHLGDADELTLARVQKLLRGDLYS